MPTSRSAKAITHLVRMMAVVGILVIHFQFLFVMTTPLLCVAADGVEKEATKEDQQQKECVMNPLDGQCINDDTGNINGTDGRGSSGADGDGSDSTLTIKPRNKTPLDKIWTEGTVDEIYEYLNCPKTNEGYSFTHTEESWETLNGLYNNLMTTKNKPSSIPPSFVTSGFQYPIEIRYDPTRGRGVFTKTLIRKGTLIWKGVNTASFDDAQDYRDFIQSLTLSSSNPDANNRNHNQLACDVLIWAYSRTVSDERDDEYLACVDLDEGSMVNSASLNNSIDNGTATITSGNDSTDTIIPNDTAAADVNDTVNCVLGLDDGPMPDNPTEQDYERIWYGCYMYFYATKDILPGTEIIADYDEFSEHAWDEMGL
mmetsp:Transcript_61379/g.150223  ORF Transcript_61379/g.150223 Transcript_61379/m.150223 type:complete len:370 (+) Transcript_61379:210-1319(+)